MMGSIVAGLAVVLGAAALTVVSALAGVALNRGLVVESVSVWPTIALWDLAAISVDSNTLLLPSFTHGPGMTAAELRDTGAFDGASNTLLFQKSRSGMRDGLTAPYAGEQLRDLRAAWIDAVQQHPIEYARHRARTFWLLVGPHRGDIQGTTYFVDRMQYRDNPPFPPPLAPAAQQALYALAADLQSSWLFAALPYLLLDAVALTVGWRRRAGPTARVALAVSSSALLYAATFVLIAPGAELRYLTWPIVAGPLALAFALSKRQWHCHIERTWRPSCARRAAKRRGGTRSQRARATRRAARGAGGWCGARRPAGTPSGRRGCGDCAG